MPIVIEPKYQVKANFQSQFLTIHDLRRFQETIAKVKSTLCTDATAYSDLSSVDAILSDICQQMCELASQGKDGSQ